MTQLLLLRFHTCYYYYSCCCVTLVVYCRDTLVITPAATDGPCRGNPACGYRALRRHLRAGETRHPLHPAGGRQRRGHGDVTPGSHRGPAAASRDEETPARSTVSPARVPPLCYRGGSGRGAVAGSGRKRMERPGQTSAPHQRPPRPPRGAARRPRPLPEGSPAPGARADPRGSGRLVQARGSRDGRGGPSAPRDASWEFRPKKPPPLRADYSSQNPSRRGVELCAGVRWLGPSGVSPEISDPKPHGENHRAAALFFPADAVR